MKKTIVAALVAASITLPAAAAQAHTYTKDSRVGSHMLNPVCKDEKTVYRLVLKNDTNRKQAFSVEAANGNGQEWVSWNHGLRPGSRYTFTFKVTSDETWSLRSTHRGEVLTYREGLTNICD